jgi:AraC-like DNA-binding protein
MKDRVLHFLGEAGKGPISLKFCERFDENSKIWNLKEHSHPYLELIYFIDGKAKVATSGAVGGEALDVGLFDLLVYPPGLLHQETLDPASRQEIVCLWLELGCRETLPFSFKLTDEEGELGRLCQWAHASHVRRTGHYRALVEHLMKLLFLFMAEKLETESSGIAALDRSRAYIAEHYAEGFDVEVLAQVACVTPSYLSRLYKKHLGTSPMRFRNAVRVEKAKHLLLVKQASVEEIADILGFTDAKHFSQLFKSVTDLSPSQFRKKYRPG